MSTCNAVDSNYPGLYPPVQPASPPVVYKRALTREIHVQTTTMLGQATEIAYGILDKRYSPPGEYSHLQENTPHIDTPQHSQSSFSRVMSSLPSINYHAGNRYEVNGIKNVTTVNNHTHIGSRRVNQTQEQEKDNTLIRVVSVIFGSLAVAVAASVIGKKSAEGQDNQDKKENFNSLVKEWNKNQVERFDYDADRTYTNTVNRIVENAQSILERKNKNQMYDIAVAVGFVAAGALALVGGIFGSPALMAGGLLLGISATVFAIYRYAYNSASKRDENEALAIHRGLWAIHGHQFGFEKGTAPSAPN